MSKVKFNLIPEIFEFEKYIINSLELDSDIEILNNFNKYLIDDYDFPHKIYDYDIINNYRKNIIENYKNKVNILENNVLINIQKQLVKINIK